VTVATASAEEAIRKSFGTSATTLDEKVTSNLTAFEKKIDALHGSSYGHITKTLIPEFARRLNALETRARPPTTDKNDPSESDTTKTESAVLEEDVHAEDVDAGVDATTRSRQAWAASRARTGVDPNPSGNITAGPPRASHTPPAGSCRGLLRNPVVSPYRPSATSFHDHTPGSGQGVSLSRPSATSFRDHTPLRQTTIPKTMHGPC
jgi:hypothetical protein